MKVKISLALKYCASHCRTLQPSYQHSFVTLANEKVTKMGLFASSRFCLSIELAEMFA